MNDQLPANQKLARKDVPSPQVLRDLLEYDVETGALSWRPRAERFFLGSARGSDVAARVWNARYAGRLAFTSLGSHGYLQGTVRRHVMLAHRVIWMIQTGLIPHKVDHINRRRTDNSWANLREVTDSENSRNVTLGKNSSTGATGVSFRNDTQKWVAHITDGRTHHLGCFGSFDEALTARRSAEVERGFHNTGGRPNG